MKIKARTRFAPSPTGFLHIGGLRTALFNHLVAKNQKGETILRIEDTDQKREVSGAVQGLTEILSWAGIEFHEGPVQGGPHTPYIQSQRSNIYKEHIKKLLDTGGAYYCFCDNQRLEKLREEQKQKKLPPRYDKRCRNLSTQEVNKKLEQGSGYVIRQKMPDQEEVKVRDFLRGEIKFASEDLEDQVLIKSDGIPTYQFASVVDDHLMEISHVVRGEEWLPSFPKNVLLYKSFGWEAPKFIHLPLILDKDGGKLSKRKNDVAVEDYKKQGYLPEALINFIALLGWHPKEDKEIMSIQEIEKEFKPEDIRTSSSIFDVDKLNYINGYYIRQTEISELTKKCLPFLEDNIQKASSDNKKTQEFLKKVVSMEQERLKKLSEIGELTEFLFIKQPKYEKEILMWKKMTKDEVEKNLKNLYKLLEEIPEKSWQREVLEEKIFDLIKKKDDKVGNYLWPLRVSLTGKDKSPGPFEVADALGKKESLERISFAIKTIS